jgi:hypothetical protein
MSLTTLTPKSPVLFRFDGTQESIDELNALLATGPGAAEYVDGDHYKFTGDTSLWPLGGAPEQTAGVMLLIAPTMSGWRIEADVTDIEAVRQLYDI